MFTISSHEIFFSNPINQPAKSYILFSQKSMPMSTFHHYFQNCQGSWKIGHFAILTRSQGVCHRYFPPLFFIDARIQLSPFSHSFIDAGRTWDRAQRHRTSLLSAMQASMSIRVCLHSPLALRALGVT